MAHMVCITEETRTRVFNCPLASYKRKDDLVALAGALSLPMEGTVAKLMKAIDKHLADNPTRANEPRFKGLFGSSRKCPSAMTTASGPSSASSEPSLVVDPTGPALPQSSLMEDALILDSPNCQMSNIHFSSGSTSMSYIHAPYMSHNASHYTLPSEGGGDVRA